MSDTDTPRVDAAEISMDRRDLRPIAKLPEYARLARTLERENRRLRSALAEVVTAARNSLPRPHPTIERNAALAGETACRVAPDPE